MDDHKIDLFEVIILTLTIYILFSLGWQTFGTVDPEVQKLLTTFDLISCVFFIYDWIRRYKFAENKWKYSLYNSLDLLASMPFLYLFSYVGYLKAIRLLRIIAIFKLFGGVNRLAFYFKNNKIHAFRLSFSIIFMLIIIISPILILYVEEQVGNIKTAEQALWWSYCTLTTIGYGDFFPSSHIGRILAVLLSASGITLFGICINALGEHFKKQNEKN